MGSAARIVIGMLLIALLATALGGCGAARQAGRYSTRALEATKNLFRVTSDEAAIKILDDAVIATGRSASLVDDAAVLWSRSVGRIEDTILARLTATPDDEAMVRSFVVGSACDAFHLARTTTMGRADVQAIVNLNRVKSRLPEFYGQAEMIRDVTDEIVSALESGDLEGSFPGLAEIFICNRLAG